MCIRDSWGFDSMLAHLLLTFQHRAGVSSYTSSFDLAQTCVFGKQLLGPILCGSISGAPLLPKLRGQFAEFLDVYKRQTLRGFKMILSGECDELPESAFLFAGTIDDVFAKAKKG